MPALTQEQSEAVEQFKRATVEFVERYSGVPHCPHCGVEAVPNPLPWVVGPSTWSCPKDGDFRAWESRVPPRDWAPTERHPQYIHGAFDSRK